MLLSFSCQKYWGVSIWMVPKNLQDRMLSLKSKLHFFCGSWGDLNVESMLDDIIESGEICRGMTMLLWRMLYRRMSLFLGDMC